MNGYFEQYEENRWYRLAGSSATSVEVLSKIMRTSNDSSTLARVAKHRNATQEMLLALTRSPYETVRRSIAERDSLSTEMLDALIKDNMTIRYYLACNPNTPIEYQKVLARDAAWRIQERIADRTDSGEIQRILAESKNFHVLLALISNIRLEAELFDYLYGKLLENPVEDSASLRYHLASNRSVPKETLERIKNDPVLEVRRRARNRLSELA